MDKEELLKTLEEWKEFRKSKNHELQYYQLAEVIHLVEQLDEPQKVKVPPYVAAWIEQAKKECRTFFEVLSDIEGACFYHKGDEPTYKWVFDNDNGVKHQEIFARAWLDGYEVEEETKYEVIIADRYLVKLFNDGRTDHRFVCRAELESWHSSAYKLTEQEIKSIDERYWPFAVPVEKV